MSKDKKMKSKTDLIIEKRPEGRLWTTIDGKDIALQIKPCFPWSYPQRYISLRDDEDDEIALIDDLSILESHFPTKYEILAVSMLVLGLGLFLAQIYNFYFQIVSIAFIIYMLGITVFALRKYSR